MRAIVALPSVRLQIDGAPLSPHIAAMLSELRVQQKLSLPNQCELTFLEDATPDDPANPFRLGALLHVTIDEQIEPLFAGEITAVEHSYGPARGRTLSVRAYDRLHRLRKRQPVRAHVQVTVQDLARELVGDLGLSVEAESSGPFHPYMIQHSQSDLDLLVEVAERAGLYPTLRGDTLHLVTLQGIGTPLPLALGESLHEARIEVSGEPACRLVTAAGWNPLQAAPYSSRASTPRSGREVTAEVDPGQVGGSGERMLVNEITVDARDHPVGGGRRRSAPAPRGARVRARSG
jgi:prophage tail gpP-like protein